MLVCSAGLTIQPLDRNGDRSDCARIMPKLVLWAKSRLFVEPRCRSRSWHPFFASQVCLGARFRKRSPLHDVVHGFGDIGRVIAHPFDILCAKEHVAAKRDVAGVLHHVGQEFPKSELLSASIS
jgi:hypothetical protein